MKFCFIGGNPKGEKEAFSPNTRSGKILRGLTKRLGLRGTVYIDIWRDQKEEDIGEVPRDMIACFRGYQEMNYQLISLGHYIEHSLRINGINTTWMPHPSRHSKALERELRRMIYAKQTRPREK